ncbi:MAG: metalloprotease TldD, partial [Gammaproteobacteria bacterium]|nr:metalloprotease TldD [Gammaproteobacteria bacterium]
HNIQAGAGLRVVSGDKSGFAYADDISANTLQRSAAIARAITRQGQSAQLKIEHRQSQSAAITNSLYPALNPLDSLSDDDKVALLQKIDQLARAKDSRVQQVNATLAGSYEVVMVNNAAGEWVVDVRPLIRCNVSVIVEQNGRRESGYAGGGGRYSYTDLIDQNLPQEFVDKAVHQALVNLESIPAPAGSMTVVLGNGWPGVLLHEAIGHGLEGDFNRKGSSAFSGRVGEQVASSLCTIVDDGTIQGRRGSLSMDDEGQQTQCTTLIENGILKGYMQDRMNARLMDVAPTGNGRRESYAHLPMPRMTNTYMLAGESDPQEIIESVKDGIYAVNFGGGQVDITSGKFVFSANEAYLIENGKVTAPVKGATLIGNGPDALTRVSMVGNDLELDTGVGVCGKEGQSVPVGVGQPTLKIDGLTVGGTA